MPAALAAGVPTRPAGQLDRRRQRAPSRTTLPEPGMPHSCVCLIPFPFAYATCETFKTIVFTMNLNDFTIQENMNFDNFNDFFVTNFGIDF